MSWQWYTPTRIVFGQGAVRHSIDYLDGLGSKAMIVTGRGGSARRNGSLSDVCTILDKRNIGYEIFEEIESNPMVTTVRRGAKLASQLEVDFIVGIGGGSPLDAAKAISVLAVNQLSNKQLFQGEFNKALPLVAVPTTAGTGSEVTPYSILTYPEIESKKSIASPLIIPVLALLDPEYTRDIPESITRDTAMDTFTHAFEGYLSVKANRISDIIAEQVLQIMGNELSKMAEGLMPDLKRRGDLLYASALAGMVISQTGTSIPHALGYSLTYFKGIPHGRANGMLTPAYAEFNLNTNGEGKTWGALNIAGFKTVSDFNKVFQMLTGDPPVCLEDEIKHYVSIAARTKNIKNNIVLPYIGDLEQIYVKTLKGRV